MVCADIDRGEASGVGAGAELVITVSRAGVPAEVCATIFSAGRILASTAAKAVLKLARVPHDADMMFKIAAITLLTCSDNKNDRIFGNAHVGVHLLFFCATI